MDELLDLVPASLEMLLRCLPPTAQIGFNLIPTLPRIPSGRVRAEMVRGLMDGAQGLCHTLNIATEGGAHLTGV